MSRPDSLLDLLEKEKGLMISIYYGNESIKEYEQGRYGLPTDKANVEICKHRKSIIVKEEIELTKVRNEIREHLIGKIMI